MMDPGELRVFGIIAVFFLAVVCGVVLALLDHQRKMAKIIRDDRAQADGLDSRVDALHSEIRELKSLLGASAQAQTQATDELRNRL